MRDDDRDLVELNVERIIIKPEAVEVRLIALTDVPEQAENLEVSNIDQQANDPQSTTITIPWAAPNFIAAKGILHTPSSQPTVKTETRDALLTAIVKARSWINELIEGRTESLAAIAKRERKVERHVRNLAQLAFLSPANYGSDRR